MRLLRMIRPPASSRISHIATFEHDKRANISEILLNFLRPGLTSFDGLIAHLDQTKPTGPPPKREQE